MENQTHTGAALPSHDLLAIRSQIHDLKEERESLKEKKRVTQVQLTKIKNLVRTGGRMPNEKYKQCCDAQSKYVAQIQTIEKRMGTIKLEIQRLADLEHYHPESPTAPKQVMKPEPMGRECIEALVALREKYQAFSADHTRVSSMRTMAAEFAFQLNPIIKAALKG
jgi:hypothetical protein